MRYFNSCFFLLTWKKKSRRNNTKSPFKLNTCPIHTSTRTTECFGRKTHHHADWSYVKVEATELQWVWKPFILSQSVQFPDFQSNSSVSFSLSSNFLPNSLPSATRHPSPPPQPITCLRFLREKGSSQPQL